MNLETAGGLGEYKQVHLQAPDYSLPRVGGGLSLQIRSRSDLAVQPAPALWGTQLFARGSRSARG